ncbi:S-type anion channel SLAH4-like [Silene latifolia]|uniref:S-type anion channel SLAH4-like n=1 Tax=Silene latifolia TaxID=37657 RepID=UPI003D77C009
MESKNDLQIVIIQAPPLITNNDSNNNNNNNTNNNNGGILSYYYYKHFVGIILPNLHAGYFRISLSLCAQILLWKTLIQFTKQNDLYYHHKLINPMFLTLPTLASTLLWSIALVVFLSLSLVYGLRCLHHFDEVKAEFLDDVGVNYLFAPSMSCLFLLQTSPFYLPVEGVIYLQVACSVFIIPIIMLDIKIYGQWFTKGKRFLSKMANPTCQLSVIANLVAAKAAIYMGWTEVGLCLFTLGMAHYLVLFVTLYQRLPGSNGLSLMLRPVFFLFIATPSMASLAWKSINGTFDNASKMLFFLSVFLFLSLVCRPSLFRKSMKKFNIAWWAYSFPLSLLALASIEYAQAVNNDVASTIAFILSVLSILVSLSLMILTSININTFFLDTKPPSNLI